MSIKLKRAFWPSFFVLSAYLFALITSSITGYLFWWAGICFLILALLFQANSKIKISSLAVSFYIYTTYLLINILFVSPVFSAMGLYFIAYLFFSFVCASNIEESKIKITAEYLLYVFVLLALWGLVQYFVDLGNLIYTGGRSNAIFATPNTFAAALNFPLLISIVLYINGYKKKYLFIFILVLFWGLLTAQSRGGYLAYLFSFSILLFLCHKKLFLFDKKRLLKLAVSLAISILIFIPVNTINKSRVDDISFEKIIETNTYFASASSMSHRMMLYDIAIKRGLEKPIFGQGYNTYQYFQQRDQIQPYIGTGTRFAHNDYLQIFMETGFTGLVLLLVVIIVALFSIFKLNKNGDKTSRIYSIVLLCPLAAMALACSIMAGSTLDAVILVIDLVNAARPMPKTTMTTIISIRLKPLLFIVRK
jgi:O-antigen ligase